MNTLTVLGAGYVGLTTATLLASIGNTVYLIEPDDERRETVTKGRSFFYEEGLDVLIADAIKSGKLIPTASYSDSIPKSSVVISCVGTPDNTDGSPNLSYVFDSAKSCIENSKRKLIFVQKSTVPVGTGSKIQELVKTTGSDIAYVSNPEFLREGTALYDTLFFDRIVVGGENQEANKTILQLYRDIEEKRSLLAKRAGINDPKIEAGKYVATSLNSAELIKVTANAFLATKISFANSIAKLADKAGADVVEVMDVVGLDKRIGRAFLNAGRGYGGGCFPKDIKGLIWSAEQYGVDMEIMKSVKNVNESMVDYTIARLASMIDIGKSSIAVLGLSFKAGTSDSRNSPGIEIANKLAKLAKSVSAFDPKANREAKHDLEDKVHIKEDVATCLQNADAVIVTVDWDEFKDSSLYDGLVVVDAVNILPKSTGNKYSGIGR